MVYHSVFIQYVTDSSRARIAGAIDRATSGAPPDAPVHYLRLEPDVGTPKFEIRLDDELLGTSRAHGTGVRWLA